MRFGHGLTAAALLLAGVSLPGAAVSQQGGAAISGSIAAHQPLGGVADRYVFDAQAGQHVVINLTSDAFDPHLFVSGPNGFAKDNDDIGDGNLNSRIDMTVPTSGRYEVTVGAFSADGAGAYRLTATGATLVRAPATVAPVAGTFGIGQPGRGRLVAGHERTIGARYIDRWTLRGTPGQHLIVRLAGDEGLDTVLYAHGTGVELMNDDASSGAAHQLDSALGVVIPANGTLTIGASSFGVGEGGYTLTATPGTIENTTPGPVTDEGSDDGDAAPSRPALTGGSPAVGTIAMGQTVSGTLAGGDGRRDPTHLQDSYAFTGSRGDRLSIRLSSREFDTYLVATSPSGDEQINDDADEPAPGQRSLDSRIEWLLPEAGTYHFNVSSYAANATGHYTLSIQHGVAPPPPPYPANRKVFVVSVGISTYPNGIGNLPNTDDDARQIRAALAAAGTVDPASVVLTNAGATRAAMRAALDRVAQQAGPNDLVVFFYSGHGVQREVPPSPAELDGMQERIVLYDGQVSDFELQQMLQPMRGKLLVILDACFAGGFNNVINRPGEMAIFSSEEDLTSEVAGPHHAGGYISYWAAQGLGGAADANSDGVITAGELAQYVRAHFYREQPIDATTTDGLHNFQHPVIDRAMPVNEPLIRVRPVR